MWLQGLRAADRVAHSRLLHAVSQHRPIAAAPPTRASLIMSCSSASVGFWPRLRITVPSSLVVMVPCRRGGCCCEDAHQARLRLNKHCCMHAAAAVTLCSPPIPPSTLTSPSRSNSAKASFISACAQTTADSRSGPGPVLLSKRLVCRQAGVRLSSRLAMPSSHSSSDRLPLPPAARRASMECAAPFTQPKTNAAKEPGPLSKGLKATTPCQERVATDSNGIQALR